MYLGPPQYVVNYWCLNYVISYTGVANTSVRVVLLLPKGRRYTLCPVFCCCWYFTYYFVWLFHVLCVVLHVVVGLSMHCGQAVVHRKFDATSPTQMTSTFCHSWFVLIEIKGYLVWNQTVWKMWLTIESRMSFFFEEHNELRVMWCG